MPAVTTMLATVPASAGEIYTVTKFIMDQNTNNRTTVLLVGVLFLLLSLPAQWFSIANATITGGSGFSPPFGMGAFTFTGLNGNLGISSVQIPIWLAITLGLLSLLFILLNQRQITSLPKCLFVIPRGISASLVILAFALAIFSSKASIHIGPVLAAIGLGIGALSYERTPDKSVG